MVSLHDIGELSLHAFLRVAISKVLQMMTLFSDLKIKANPCLISDNGADRGVWGIGRVTQGLIIVFFTRFISIGRINLVVFVRLSQLSCATSSQPEMLTYVRM